MYRANAGSFPHIDVVFSSKRSNLAAAVKGMWRNDLVVRFLPLSFYAKKKVAERKARIRGGGAKDARIREHMAAPVPPSYVSPPYNCSADSDSFCLYPKRSSGTMTPVSKRKVSRLLP